MFHSYGSIQTVVLKGFVESGQQGFSVQEAFDSFCKRIAIQSQNLVIFGNVNIIRCR
jgi:hypothetical protein